MDHRLVRSVVAGLVLALAPLTAANASVSAARPSPVAAHVTATSTWGQRDADAARSDDNPDEAVLTSSTVAGLRLRYRLSKVAPYGRCGSGDFSGDLPVSDGSSLYWFDGLRVRASSLQSGATRWKAPVLDATGATVVRQIAVSDGRVVVVTGGCGLFDALDPAGDVVVHSAATGAVLWRTPATDEPVPRSVVVSGSSLVVSGTRRGSGSSPLEQPTTTSYDVATGTPRWRNPQCSASGTFGEDDVFVVGDVVPSDQCVLPSAVLESAGLSLATGLPRWTTTWGAAYTRGDAPGVGSPSVYLSDRSGHVAAMTPRRHRLWRAGPGRVLAAGPALVYTDCGTTTSVCALDRSTGAVRWTADVGDNAAGVAVGADVVYPYLLDATTGTALRTDASVTLTGRTGVAGGRVWSEHGRTVDVLGLG